ncbi:hypothetical protein HMPREF0972_01815 [Actinomyces sp. oral taxon 848 str. F0332]|nr:hypothetical protein HMPREF0972_01815 [Actinomyces sp. oral taxon 848 str. F0332]
MTANRRSDKNLSTNNAKKRRIYFSFVSQKLLTKTSVGQRSQAKKPNPRFGESWGESPGTQTHRPAIRPVKPDQNLEKTL